MDVNVSLQTVKNGFDRLDHSFDLGCRRPVVGSPYSQSFFLAIHTEQAT